MAYNSSNKELTRRKERAAVPALIEREMDDEALYKAVMLNLPNY
jgi:hypothetical protein